MARRGVSGLVVLAALAAGCKSGAGGGGGDSPEAVFAAFNQAMVGQDYATAAALVGYDEMAQAANPDWDSFAQQQRNEIAKRMQEDTQAGLGQVTYPAGGLTAQAPQLSGEQATVTGAGGGVTLTLQLTKTTEGWKITGGVPGMTSQSGMSGG